MSRIDFLRGQIERCKRLARLSGDDAARQGLVTLAAQYQGELDALSATDTKQANASTADAIASPSETITAAPSDAIAATDDGDAITAKDDGQQGTD